MPPSRQRGGADAGSRFRGGHSRAKSVLKLAGSKEAWPRPGGWNRVVLRVADLPAQIDALKKAGVKFRNQMEAGPGGRQIQVEDPDGNSIELFEPAR